MIELFRSPRTILAELIAAHKKARAARLKLQNRSSAIWSIFVYPMTSLARWREARALWRLASARPEGPEASKAKTLYLLALIMVDRAPPSNSCLEMAIDTLRPYRSMLAGYLSRSRSGAHASRE